MTSKTFQRLQGNASFLTTYLTSVGALFTSGFFDVLREFGRIDISLQDSNDKLSVKAAYSAGYNAAIDDILNFKEKYMDKPVVTNLTPDFGGRDYAVKVGNLTQKEADSLRNK